MQKFTFLSLTISIQYFFLIHKHFKDFNKEEPKDFQYRRTLINVGIERGRHILILKIVVRTVQTMNQYGLLNQ